MGKVRDFFLGKKVPAHEASIVDTEFLSVPVAGLEEQISQYIGLIETGATEDYCRCTWRLHPDDVNRPKGERRKVRIEEDPTCWVHTKEGFLRGFFDWAFGEVEVRDETKS